MKKNIEDTSGGGGSTLNGGPAKAMTLDELLASVTDEEAAAAAKGAPAGGPRRPQAPVEFTELITEDALDPEDEPRWITPYITRGEITAFVSSPGDGKSLVLLTIMLAMALNKPATIGLGVDGFGYPGVALYVSNEDRRSDIRRRQQAWMLAHGITPKKRDCGLLLVEQPGQLVVIAEGDEKGSVQLNMVVIEALEEKIVALRNNMTDVAMVVLDTMITVLSGIEENDNSAMGAAMALIGKWAEKMDVAVVLLAHTPKAVKQLAGSSRIRGASATGGTIRAMQEVQRLEESEEQRLPVRERGRWISITGQKANHTQRSLRQWGFINSYAVPTLTHRSGVTGATTTDTAWLEFKWEGPFPSFDPKFGINHRDVIDVLLGREAAGRLTWAAAGGKKPDCIVPVIQEALEHEERRPTRSEAEAVLEVMRADGLLANRPTTPAERRNQTDRHPRDVVEVTSAGRVLVGIAEGAAGAGSPNPTQQPTGSA